MSATTLPMRSRLVSARVITLLILLRTSADLSFARANLPELGRRLVWLIGIYGGLTSIELVGLTGQEKAQISRTVQALSRAGLIDRPSLRARMELSPAGQAVHATLTHIAIARDDWMVRGIARDELARFLAKSRGLIDRAALLLARERAIGANAEPETGNREAGATALPLPEPPSRAGRLATMVAPALSALNAYLGRSATITFRRETGLSKFNWQILSQIGEYQPVTLTRLVALSYRDKSQVGRAVAQLEAEGLVARRRARGARAVTLACTPAGNIRYAAMCEIGRDRDDFLCADLSHAERRAYIATLDRITANAEALLAHERAVAGT